MFRLFRTVGCLSAAVCIVTPVMAQRHPTTPEFQEVKILNDKDSSGINEINVYETFVENAPKAYNIPGAPRFAIVGKDRKFYLGIGPLRQDKSSGCFPSSTGTPRSLLRSTC